MLIHAENHLRLAVSFFAFMAMPTTAWITSNLDLPFESRSCTDTRMGLPDIASEEAYRWLSHLLFLFFLYHLLRPHILFLPFFSYFCLLLTNTQSFHFVVGCPLVTSTYEGNVLLQHSILNNFKVSDQFSHHFTLFL